MVDVLALEASAERRVGSSPTFRTNLSKTHTLWVFFLTYYCDFERFALAKTIPLSRKKTNQFMLIGVLSFLAIFIGVAIAQLTHNHSERQSVLHLTSSDKSQSLIKSFFSQKGSNQ